MPRKREVSDGEVTRVFEDWRRRQKRPEACRLTDDRIDLIRARMAKGYEVEDFLALFEYAWEADSPEARFWRGDNSRRRTYLDLANLLRAGKLAGRIESAMNWRLDKQDRESDSLGRFRLSSPHVGLGLSSGTTAPTPTRPPTRRPSEPVRITTPKERASDSLGLFALSMPGGDS